MKEFLLVFRNELAPTEIRLSAEQYQTLAKKWQDWIGSLAAQNKYVASGKRMSPDGKVVQNNKTITNGPFVEIKEGIVGYMFIKAKDIDEAAELAKDSPIIFMGGNVEVREIIPDGY
jgi:hypothetical protein